MNTHICFIFIKTASYITINALIILYDYLIINETLLKKKTQKKNNNNS